MGSYQVVRTSPVYPGTDRVVPGAVVRMVAHQRKGEISQANELGQILAPLFKLVGCKAGREMRLPSRETVIVEDRFRNPVPLKTMLAALGVPVGPGRPPLGKMTLAGVTQCREALRQVWARAPELLRPLNDPFGTNVERRLADDSAWAQVTRA